MPTLMPHQIEGAAFLAARTAALLADEPRVGKTGAAIEASERVFARTILVVTKASARANWQREFREWAGRDAKVIYKAADVIPKAANVVIVGWGMVFDKALLDRLALRAWDVLILDESHEAKNPAAKRTQAVYDVLAPRADRVWCLTGTPTPNAPNDLFPMLAALSPERLNGESAYEAFVDRYCVTRPKFIGGKRIEVVVGGKNIDELRQRLMGFWLRRTQADVGINPPIYSLYAVTPSDADLKVLNHALFQVEPRAAAILAAAEDGDTAGLEMHMGPLRRLTGQIKAAAVARLVREEIENEGLDRIVLMAWHTDVLDSLGRELGDLGVAQLDGRTPATERQRVVDRFQSGAARVFLGQILAAGEAIDLSASCNLMFVEGSFTPKDMAQAALRITNHTQKRQALVRVCVLGGSIDEALMKIVMRKVQTIRQIQEKPSAD